MKKFQITFKGQVYELDVEEMNTANVSAGQPIVSAPARVETPPSTPVKAVATPKKVPVSVGAATILAPMPGKILAVNVKKGDAVKRGQVVCILEAMKMENEIMANQDGTISDVRVTVGQTISTGDVLIVIG
jgi:biotin carboxyl carrier protein